jgi:hypothetical protein
MSPVNRLLNLALRKYLFKFCKKVLQTIFFCVYNLIVAVRSDQLKPLNSTLALGFCSRVLTEGRAKWLFYVHLIASVLHTKVVHLHGWLGRKHRHQDTPPVCRPALVERLVKHLVQRWNKARCIRELTRQAHLVLFRYLIIKSMER